MGGKFRKYGEGLFYLIKCSRNNQDKMFKVLMTNNRIQERYDKKVIKIQQEHDESENKYARKTRELQRKIDNAVK